MDYKLKKITVLSSLLLAASLYVTPASASPETMTVVQKGDTLWKIADIHLTTVEHIMTLNKMKNTNIKVGQHLKLVDTHKKEISSTNSFNKKYHTVKTGDTLWSISKKYKVKVEDIKKMNNMKNNNIKYGQNLVISKNL